MNEGNRALLQVKVREMAMKTRRVTKRLVMTSLLALLTPIVLFAPQAYAESYVGGQIGATFPQSLSNGVVTQDGFGGLDISDQDLQKSAMVGGKLGHYFTPPRISNKGSLYFRAPAERQLRLVWRAFTNK
jgi:hypothetical protein